MVILNLASRVPRPSSPLLHIPFSVNAKSTLQTRNKHTGADISTQIIYNCRFTCCACRSVQQMYVLPSAGRSSQSRDLHYRGRFDSCRRNLCARDCGLVLSRAFNFSSASIERLSRYQWSYSLSCSSPRKACSGRIVITGSSIYKSCACRSDILSQKPSRMDAAIA